jgi:hypothetical protein
LISIERFSLHQVCYEANFWSHILKNLTLADFDYDSFHTRQERNFLTLGHTAEIYNELLRTTNLTHKYYKVELSW